MHTIFPLLVVLAVQFPNYFEERQTLAHSLPSVSPHLRIDPDDAFIHAGFAMQFETPEISRYMILSMSWHESNLIPEATTYLVKTEDPDTGEVTWPRVGGVIQWKSPPAGVKGPYCCGVLQVRAKTWEGCLKLRDLETGYREGVKVLTQWLEKCQSYGIKNPREKMRCALLRYGGVSKEKWKTSTFPGEILGRTERLKRATERAAGNI